MENSLVIPKRIKHRIICLYIHVFIIHIYNHQLIGKDPDAGNDARQQEKGTTENEMIRWHH